MKRIWLLSLILMGLGGVLLLLPHFQSSVPTSVANPSLPTPSPEQQDLQYQVYSLASSEVHTLRIPAQERFRVGVAVADRVETLENFAQQSGAIAVLNGGFFDPVNQQSTSYIIQQGQLVADPRRNERLMNNPDLAPYLSQILDRTEFRRYQCGATIRYDITRRSTSSPPGCQLQEALGGGPQLLLTLTAEPEGFVSTVDGRVVRDPLGSQAANARTAVGITAAGDLIWIMVAQKPDAVTDSGLSLPALAEFLKTLGVEKAMNLDGGSSSAFYFQGKTTYGKLDEAGGMVKRPVKSVLLIQDSQPALQ